MATVHRRSLKTIPEVFEAAKGMDNDEQVKLLKENDSKGLRFIVNGMYNVDWSGMKLPLFKYSDKPEAICESSIGLCIKRIDAAYRIRHDNPKRSEELMELVLESVSKEEADLLVNMIKGKKIDGISKTVFKKAFPGFFLD